ncbi:MAG TPA: ATP-binding protein [Streptomyces sp.]|nr:ATP-binding protein [Streptomyces sp.]
MNGDKDLGEAQVQRVGAGRAAETSPGAVAVADAGADEQGVRDVTGEAARVAEESPAGRRTWAGAAYDGTAEAIGDARRLVVGFLAQLIEDRGSEVSSRVAGAAQLVVSELVTNACKYAPGPCVVNVEMIGPVLEITVWDSESALPVAQAAEPGRVGGHGLEIVRSLCESLEVLCEPIGKQVKARIPVWPAHELTA